MSLFVSNGEKNSIKQFGLKLPANLIYSSRAGIRYPAIFGGRSCLDHNGQQLLGDLWKQFVDEKRKNLGFFQFSSSSSPKKKQKKKDG